jgi:uncharacterized protein YqhQ
MNIFKMAINFLHISVGLLAKKNTVGGQAIIEGVMMRGKEKVSWAVKSFKGDVVVESQPFVSLTKKIKILGWPVVRGAINLWESLEIGFKALSRSAELATEEPSTGKSSFKDQLLSFLTMALALVFSVVFFMYLPLKILSFFVPKESAFLFNILAGVLRIVFFVIYLCLISLIKDIRRVFEYHGAEHKSIFAFEDGKDLTVDIVKQYTTFHPRCGTSFILLVGIVCMLLFGMIDALIIKFIGPYPTILVRTLTHIALIPLVSGLSYEVLKFSDRYQHFSIVRFFIMPGLWLQRITTREPDDQQIDIAIQALKAVL